ncbi:metallophosphoesterase [Hyphomicrobium sulfonivorans]|nr:metallophosphoesterase [Hyphomicrobium sulfonivorans]
MITRRQFFMGFGVAGLAGAGTGGYALAESFGSNITRYQMTPPGWPQDLPVRLLVLSDLHACDPWMTAERIAGMVEQVNTLQPDCVLLLGDYVAGHSIGRFSKPVPHREWANALAGLKAPMGVHAVLGNHDWWEDWDVVRRRRGPTKAGIALQEAGITVHENTCVRLNKNGRHFWLAGLGDQWAFPSHRDGRRHFEGTDDLPGTLAQVSDDAPIIMMVHEPDIFASMPARVSLTLAGHTHGGQVRLFGYAPVVPSRFGQRYLYGHIVEDNRHMIVSGGLGCSAVPVRLGAPPEIVQIDLGTAQL